MKVGDRMWTPYTAACVARGSWRGGSGRRDEVGLSTGDSLVGRSGERRFLASRSAAE